jgi:hypothetical protein
MFVFANLYFIDAFLNTKRIHLNINGRKNLANLIKYQCLQ